MIYNICYELIKSSILIIILHYLFLYIKNLFIEVYEFNPLEIPLNILQPIKKMDVSSKVSPTNIKEELDQTKCIKDELIDFVNSEFDDKGECDYEGDYDGEYDIN